MPANATSSESDPQPAPGDNTRAFVSLLLFIHLFIVLVCLAANLTPSELEMRLLHMFRPYAQLLNFDLDGTRYYLTHATENDVDHRWEVLPVESDEGTENEWQVMRRGLRGGERYLRYQRFADALAFSAESDELPSLLAEGVARHYSQQLETPLQELRCRRHSLQAFATAANADELADPDNPAYFSEVYRAQVVATEGGSIHVVKREPPALEAAVKSTEPTP
jgi:hypothetical protein